MTRVKFDVTFPIQGNSWTIYFSGLGLNQDLFCSFGSRTVLLSDPDSDFSGADFLTRLDGESLAVHINFENIPASCDSFTLEIQARAQTFMHWKLSSPAGEVFDTDGSLVPKGTRIQVLEFSRESGWSFSASDKDLDHQEEAHQSNRLPAGLRTLHALAKNLDIAMGGNQVGVLVYASASMLKVLGDPVFINMMEALRATSLSTGLEPLRVRFAGRQDVWEIWPTGDISAELDAFQKTHEDKYLNVEAMMDLVPLLLTADFLLPGGTLFILTDTWFFVSSLLEKRLEENSINLVVVKMLDTELEDEVVNYRHPRVHLRTVVGFGKANSAENILSRLA
jgi:hypothetical protein